MAVRRKWKFNQRIQALQFRSEFGQRRDLTNATVGVGQNGPWVFGTLMHEGVKLEQERQCTHNVTLRRVRVSIVTVGKQ